MGLGTRTGMLGLVLLAASACSFDSSGLGREAGGTDSGTAGTGQATSGDGSGAPPTASGAATTTAATSTAATTSDEPDPATTGSSECMGGGDWWDARWERRRRLTVEALPTNNDQTNIPVLVRLDGERIETDVTTSDGRDIRFVTDDGTILAHEIETWNADGTAAVWVKIPRLSTEASTQWWMYYGNLDAPDASDPETLWDNYLSVHHLTDRSDSSGNGKNAFSDSPPTEVTGQVGGAQGFDGQDDYLELPDEAYFDLLDGFTISVWARVEVFDRNWQTVVVKGDRQWRIHRNNNGSEINFGTTAQGNNWDNIPGQTPIDDEAWHHIAVVYNGSGRWLFVDGQIDASDDWSEPQQDTDFTVYIGENNQATGRHFHGDIDELRISDIPYGGGWHRTQYRSMTDQLIVFGAREDCD